MHAFPPFWCHTPPPTFGEVLHPQHQPEQAGKGVGDLQQGQRKGDQPPRIIAKLLADLCRQCALNRCETIIVQTSAASG